MELIHVKLSRGTSGARTHINVAMQSVQDFVRFTLIKQLEVAKKARDIDNRERILFDVTFEAISTRMVGQYRIDVDAQGREAILSAGAQATFTADIYLQYAPSDYDIIRRANVIFLQRKS